MSHTVGENAPVSKNGKFVDTLTDHLVRYRWVLVVPVVLPLSTLFNLFWIVRNRYYRRWRNAPAEHENRVRRIQDQIRQWRASGSEGLLCTARKNWQSVSTRVVRYKKPHNSIKIDLHDILKVDTRRSIIRVEPLVNMGQITRRLNPIGWTLPVVPELDELTVGGLILGYGVEVSSHKYGLFSELVEACEVVLGDGSVVRASRRKNADLFYALPWSHGALGFLVSVDLRIIPCKPYVHLTYHPVHSLEDACERFEKESSGENSSEFVEGIMFSPNEGVVTTGNFADRPKNGKVNAIDRWYKPWFYTHCESFMKIGGGNEYIPIRHYYRRHMRGMFWEAKLIIPFGNHPLFRYLLGWLMPPKISFLRLTQGERIRKYYEDRHVIQDALVPVSRLKETVQFFHGIFECYPLWFCPLRIYRTRPQGFVKPSEKAEAHEIFVDIAACGVPGPVSRNEAYNGREAVKKMEAYLIERGGYQALYAVTEMSHSGFQSMFDCTLYQYGGQFSLTKKCRSRRLGIIDHHVNDTLYLERRHNGTGRKDTQEFQDFQASKKVSDGCVYSDPNSSRQDQFS